MRENESHRLIRVRDNMNADISDEVARFVNGFKAFQGNVLSTLQFDEVLDPESS